NLVVPRHGYLAWLGAVEHSRVASGRTEERGEREGRDLALPDELESAALGGHTATELLELQAPKGAPAEPDTRREGIGLDRHHPSVLGREIGGGWFGRGRRRWRGPVLCRGLGDDFLRRRNNARVRSRVPADDELLIQDQEHHRERHTEQHPTLIHVTTPS